MSTHFSVWSNCYPLLCDPPHVSKYMPHSVKALASLCQNPSLPCQNLCLSVCIQPPSLFSHHSSWLCVFSHRVYSLHDNSSGQVKSHTKSTFTHFLSTPAAQITVTTEKLLNKSCIFTRILVMMLVIRRCNHVFSCILGEYYFLFFKRWGVNSCLGEYYFWLKAGMSDNIRVIRGCEK